MSYVKADCVLPKELLDEIRQYVDGAYLYIPRAPQSKRAWGEGTTSRAETAARNNAIYTDYQNGLCYAALSVKYFLSVKSVQRIVLRLKNEKR